MQTLIQNHLMHLREKRPLILNITNNVTMDFIANGLSCIGASPLMSQAPEELESLIQLAACTVINLGTLSAPFLALAERACELSVHYHKPIILDPVGAGATPYRTQAARDLLTHYKIAIVRGNASEIAALENNAIATKGIDSLLETSHALHYAQTIANTYHTTLCISGKIDIIVDTTREERYAHGSALMPQVVGTGCLLSAVVAAFHAIEPDPFVAAATATLYYGLCGERAAEKACTPMHFKNVFLDELYTYTPTYLGRAQRDLHEFSRAAPHPK